MKGWPGEPDMEYDTLVADGNAAQAVGSPVTDVIFDFGNVLIYWEPGAVLVPRYSEAMVDEFLDNDISGFYDANNMMDAGASHEEAIAWVRSTHGGMWADVLAYYLENFEDSLVGTVPGARVLVNDLKAAGIGVWGLSNWERTLYPIAEKQCPILGGLDGKVISGYVGMRKPYRDIYELALERFGITASGAVFVDDKAMNIVGANEAGIRGVRFRDPRKLRALLISMGVNIPAIR